jgi:hypothetical protein
MPKDGNKRKEREKDRPKKGRRVATSAATPSGEPTVAEAMGAAAMGPVASRSELPSTRAELTELWQEARRRRHTSQLGSEAYIQACEDIARLEVEIATVERSLTPPLV